MNCPQTTVAWLIVALLIMPALAKEQPPVGGPARDFTLPEIERLQLKNGLNITLIPFGKIPKLSIRVDVNTGNMNEGDDTWLADLTGELIKEGTETRAAELIAKQTARMGGQLSLSTGLNQTSVNLQVLSEFADDAIALVAETLQQPLFPASELERLRTNLIRNRSLALSQPQTIADAAFIDLLYPDHSYGRAFPSEEQLNSYTMEKVRAYYDDNFGARRSHIMVVGQFNRNAVLKAIRKNFAHWRAGPNSLRDPATASTKFQLKLIDRPGAPQSTILLGLPVLNVTDPEFRAFSQMQTLLGGYFSSRITANIREDKGYAYSPRSRLAPILDAAYWQQSADVTTEHTGAALTEILKEIEILRKTPPSAEEVSDIQNYQTGIFVLAHATPNGLLSRISYMALHDLPDSYLSGYLSYINKITPSQHQALAQKYLNIGQMTIVIVGDMEKIKPQINAVPELQSATRL